MKQLAYFIIGLGIGFLACKYLFQTEDIIGDMEEIEIVKPKGVIPPERAKELDQNFNERHALINKELGIDDNRSSWYSLTDIKDYLDYAENQSKDLRATMDGIRIYVGAYEDKGLTTMFLVPTSSTKIQKGSSLPFGMFTQGGSRDIKGADVLNMGGAGYPPSANYPQQNLND